jgi:hypothetical protein
MRGLKNARYAATGWAVADGWSYYLDDHNLAADSVSAEIIVVQR